LSKERATDEAVDVGEEIDVLLGEDEAPTSSRVLATTVATARGDDVEGDVTLPFYTDSADKTVVELLLNYPRQFITGTHKVAYANTNYT